MKHFIKETLGWILYPLLWALDREFRRYEKRQKAPDDGRCCP